MENNFHINRPEDIGKQKQKISAKELKGIKAKVDKVNLRPSSHCLLCKNTIDEMDKFNHTCGVQTPNRRLPLSEKYHIQSSFEYDYRIRG